MRCPLVVATLVAVVVAIMAPMPTAAAECSPGPTASDCDPQTRIAAADEYLATRPGLVGYLLRDRKIFATYRNSHAGQVVWTASNIRLAMVVDLLTRQRAGPVALSDSHRSLMTAMMHSSDDDAADALWAPTGLR